MKNLTIGKRIVLGTSFLCLIIIALSLFSVIRMRSLNRISDSIVSDSLPGLIAAGKMNALQAENQIRCGLLLTAKNAEQRKAIRVEMDASAQAMNQIVSNYEATIFAEEDRSNFNKFGETRVEYHNLREQFFTLVETNPAAASEFLNTTLMPAYDAFSKAGDIVMDYNSKMGDARGKSLTAQVSSGVTILTMTGVISLVAGILGSFLIVTSISSALRSIAANIADGANQTASASAQVSASSQTLAEGASESAASLEETGASLEELTSMTKRNAENAQKANDLAKQTREAADKGAGDMQTMSAAMEAIKVSSDDIAKIIKTIDEIAFQTNILALNAAVEAARAGEAGMGFAVVADEVRNLAQRSAQAAKETAGKIEGAITKTAQGVVISDKVAQALNEIVTKARQMDELVTEVAGASREQTQGIAQIGTAVGQMDKVTQSTAASAEESASASQELNAQAETLKSTVHKLNRLVGGEQVGGASVQPFNQGAQTQKNGNRLTKMSFSAGAVQRNGNQPERAAAVVSTNGHRKSAAIPMDGDFKDF
jgi:methyl-accepting chemotaxis protein